MGFTDIVEYLVKNGADLNKDKNRRSALALANIYNPPNTLKYLRDIGKNIVIQK